MPHAVPTLTRLDLPGARRPRGLVLLLHGGAQAGHRPVDTRSASWRRMAALQRAITPGAHDADVATWLLAWSERGWNGGAPIADARTALAACRRELPGVPVVLLGHSMGARVAVRVADDEAVVGVVGLAPWWQPEDPVAALAGTPVVAAHGRSHKITSARATRAYLRRAEPVAARTEFVSMGRVGHYMLRRVPRWYDVALTRSLALLP